MTRRNGKATVAKGSWIRLEKLAFAADQCLDFWRTGSMRKHYKGLKRGGSKESNSMPAET